MGLRNAESGAEAKVRNKANWVGPRPVGRGSGVAWSLDDRPCGLVPVHCAKQSQSVRPVDQGHECRSDDRAEQSQFPVAELARNRRRAGTPSLFCETKPIPAPALRRGRDAFCETKPIRGQIVLRNKPNSDGRRMKQSQFEIGQRDAKYWSGQELRQRLSAGSAGKQSQFALPGSGGRDPPYGRTCVRNKANLQGVRSLGCQAGEAER